MCTRNGAHLVERDVADQAVPPLLARVGHGVGPHVDHRRPGLDPRSLDHLGLSRRRDDDVCLPARSFRGRACGECTIVTVASRDMSSSAAGRPTMLLRPTTTALFPAISTPILSSSAMHPLGVHDTYLGCRPRIAIEPMEAGWKPSTSFSRSIASKIVVSSMCLGRGSWTRMPWTLGSALKSATTCRE